MTQKVELRSDKPEETCKIIGYAAKFNSRSHVLGWFEEIILPGAFDGCLNDDVRALKNHNADFILGRTKAGTLALKVDEFGLRYEIIPPETTYANDLVISMRRGDIDQSSFAFSVDADDEEWEYDEERSIYIRTIKKVKRLYDVSPVTYPAYENTDSVVSRSKESIEKELEKLKPISFDQIKLRRLELELLEKSN